MKYLKIPSKTFLLGEYAVLKGGHAVVLTHPPFFSAQKTEKPTLFHSNSPASRLMLKNRLLQDFDFLDPHSGGGGFGGSTAEVVSSLKGRASYTPESLLKDYLDLFKDQGARPSGADLYAQWMEAKEGALEHSTITVYNTKNIKDSMSLPWPFEDVAIMIFKRPKKTKTHQHLSSLNLNSDQFRKLVKITDDGVDCLKNKNSAFFKQIELFASEQSKLSLIDEKSFQEVSQIKQISSVRTARACGALGMDVVSVFCDLKKDSEKEDLDKVKAKIVDFDFGYNHVATLDRGDFIRD